MVRTELEARALLNYTPFLTSLCAMFVVCPITTRPTRPLRSSRARFSSSTRRCSIDVVNQRCMCSSSRVHYRSSNTKELGIALARFTISSHGTRLTSRISQNTFKFFRECSLSHPCTPFQGLMYCTGMRGYILTMRSECLLPALLVSAQDI